MDGSDRDGAGEIEAVRVIVGGQTASSPGMTARGMHTADGLDLVSIDDATDIVAVARFLRDYRGPGLDGGSAAQATEGLAALLHPQQSPSEEQRAMACDVLGSIASGTLSAAAPALRPAAVSLLRHFA